MDDLFPQSVRYMDLKKNSPSHTHKTNSWVFGIEQKTFEKAINDCVTHLRFSVTMAKQYAADAQKALAAGFKRGDTYVCSMSAANRFKRQAMNSNGTYLMIPVDKMEKVG